MTCFSFGSGLWLSKIWEVGLPSYPPYTLEVGWKRKAHKKAMVRNETHLSDSRDHPRNLQNFISKNFIKPLDWWLNKGVVSGTLQAVLTLNRQRWGWCYKPHRSKVKRANKANLSRIKVRTLGCALCISQECDIVATPDQQPKSKTLLGTSKGLAWGSCWGSLSAKSDCQLDSIIKENYMPYSHICITNPAP